jgi:hypothetical protein
MWTMVARMVAVFAGWGAVLAAAAGAGWASRDVELGVLAAAGVTLIVLSFVVRPGFTLTPAEDEPTPKDRASL